MTIARAIKEQMSGSSLIRKMFEEGERQEDLQRDKVYDFSIATDLEPPRLF